MVKKISGYFSLTNLNESKQKRGFVTNGNRRKTRQGTQAALMGMSATVGPGSTAYDAFRKENQEENGEDEFKIGKTFSFIYEFYFYIEKHLFEKKLLNKSLV